MDANGESKGRADDGGKCISSFQRDRDDGETAEEERA